MEDPRHGVMALRAFGARALILKRGGEGRVRVRGGLVLAGAGLLYLALAIGFFATIWSHPGRASSTALGVGGDPQLAIWFLRWQAFALANGHNLVFTTYLDAPGGVNLMWNTTAPVLGVVLAPLT